MNIGGVPQSRLPQRQSVKAGGGDATTVSTAAPAQAQPAQPTQPTGQVQASSVLTSFFDGLMNLFKGFFSFLGNLFHRASATTTSTASTTPSAPSTPVTGTPATPTANGLDAQSAAIAQQYGLLPTAANLQAFVAETQGYTAANSGVLGPGATNVQGVRDLQTALAKLGYPVQVNGQYDQATMMAVKSFKQANGMHQSYQMADGSYGVNEYADTVTQAVIKTKAGQAGATQPASPTQGTQSTQSTAPANWQPMASQYHLLPTQDNVATFMAEVKAYQQEGALGPGTPNTQAVTDLQSALAKLGYQVTANGQYDAATQQAVIAFKTANGLHQTYKAADGNFAINEYADAQTLQLMMSKLQATVTGQPAAPAQPVQTPAAPVQTPAAPVQTPAQQPAGGLQGPWDLPAGQRDYYAIQQSYHVYGDPANMDAFCNEMKSYESNGALGPNSTNTQAITDLQGALARLGYQVPQSGHYDQATMQAVMAFKQANGIHQSYKGLDGNFAINEFAETQTLQAIMQKLQSQVAGQPAQPVQAPAQPVQQPAAPVQQPAQQPAQGSTNTAAIAAQYHIQNSADNVNAFLNEVKQYQTDGALGPGSNQTQAINDLQTVLAKFGFQVQATGQYDAATQQAVIAFKKANGLHQSYKATDGNWAVNEYADKQTLELIMTKLQQQMNKAS